MLLSNETERVRTGVECVRHLGMFATVHAIESMNEIDQVLRLLIQVDHRRVRVHADAMQLTAVDHHDLRKCIEVLRSNGFDQFLDVFVDFGQSRGKQCRCFSRSLHRLGGRNGLLHRVEDQDHDAEFRPMISRVNARGKALILT